MSLSEHLGRMVILTFVWAFATTGNFTARVYSSLEPLLLENSFLCWRKHLSSIKFLFVPIFALFEVTQGKSNSSPFFFITQQKFQGSYIILFSPILFPSSLYQLPCTNIRPFTTLGTCLWTQFINVSLKIWYPELNSTLHPDVDWPMRHAGLPGLLLPQAECTDFVNGHDALLIQCWTPILTWTAMKPGLFNTLPINIHVSNTSLYLEGCI